MYYNCSKHGSYAIPFCVSTSIYNLIKGKKLIEIKDIFIAAIYHPGFTKKVGLSTGQKFDSFLTLAALDLDDFVKTSPHCLENRSKYKEIYPDAYASSKPELSTEIVFFDRDLDRRLLNDRLVIEKFRKSMNSMCPICVEQKIFSSR